MFFSLGRPLNKRLFLGWIQYKRQKHAPAPITAPAATDATVPSSDIPPFVPCIRQPRPPPKDSKVLEAYGGSK